MSLFVLLVAFTAQAQDVCFASDHAELRLALEDTFPAAESLNIEMDAAGATTLTILSNDPAASRSLPGRMEATFISADSWVATTALDISDLGPSAGSAAEPFLPELSLGVGVDCVYTESCDCIICWEILE